MSVYETSITNPKKQLEFYKQLSEQLQQENQELKKQLKYLRSGEYYNQLRFENEMLQQVVDTNGVPSEVYDYIDCTHRNTELLEENQKLKDRDLIIAAELTKLQDENIRLKKESQKQKEVIDRLNFIKNRKNQGASQENINKMAIEFVNSYLKEVS